MLLTSPNSSSTTSSGYMVFHEALFLIAIHDFYLTSSVSCFRSLTPHYVSRQLIILKQMDRQNEQIAHLNSTYASTHDTIHPVGLVILSPLSWHIIMLHTLQLECHPFTSFFNDTPISRLTLRCPTCNPKMQQLKAF